MWFVAAALPVWLIVLATFLWLRAGEPRTRVGPATALTLVRGGLVGALAGCALLPARGWVAWLPGALYTTAAVADLFDGYLARRRDEVTTLGSRLDVAMDALGLLVAPVVAVALGRLPPWYLLLGAAYYLFRAGLWLRRRRGLPLHEDRLRPDPRARVFAGYQMGLVATVLFPVLRPPGTFIAATLFMVPTLALFTREWLLVTGRVTPEWGAGALLAGRRWLGLVLPGLRALVTGGLVALVATGRISPLVLVAAALLAAGVLTRLTAFATAAALTTILGGGAGLPLVIYLMTLLLLLAGGGRGVLWNPEDRWMVMKAGARRSVIAPVDQ